jgi:hypothetical protein
LKKPTVADGKVSALREEKRGKFKWWPVLLSSGLVGYPAQLASRLLPGLFPGFQVARISLRIHHTGAD